MMSASALLLALSLGQSAPGATASYIRSHVDKNNTNTQCLFWTVPTITWNLSSVGNPASVDAQKPREFEAIRSAFASWQRIFTDCGNLSFVEGPMVDDRDVGYVQDGDNRNLILFRSVRCTDVAPSTDSCWDDDTCANAHDCWDNDARTIALTLTTYDERSGIIYDSDVQLNASGFVFTTASSPVCPLPVTGKSPNCVATDVQNTMTHELGHFIGLDHISLATSVMYPQAPSGETSKRTIDAGSRQFVCAAYPKGHPSQSCITPVLDTTGGSDTLVLGKRSVGCSSTAAGPWPWALLALARLRGRRRGARS